MKDGDLIKFDTEKNFKFLKPLGQGGTGETYLFLDETTNMYFAIKKYVPNDVENTDDHYFRFVEEIKILFKISHPNIVRIYNYYLYPGWKTGYLQMEYVDGVTIDKYTVSESKDWNDIFREAVSAFLYLESNRILHRDIREANIMINNMNEVKIIDFGFGKSLHADISEENSILLNWPAPQPPEEVEKYGEYTVASEIYYLGWLFSRLIKDESDFKYTILLEKMTKHSTSERFSSFSDILVEINSKMTFYPSFDTQQKETFQTFADALQRIIAEFNTPLSMYDLEQIIDNLSKILKNSSLEKIIQGNFNLINCFFYNEYLYWQQFEIEVSIVQNFYNMLVELSSDKANIVYDNLKARLSTIELNVKNKDEVPF